MKDSLAILKQALAMAELRAGGPLHGAKYKKVVDELRKHVSIVEKCPPDKRSAVAAALRILQPKYVGLPGGEEVDKVVTGYPGATRQQTARLLLGDAPVKLAPGLTRAEAHEWLSQHPNRPPSNWLLSREFGELSRSRSGIDRSHPCGPNSQSGIAVAGGVQHVEVARWILKTLSKKPTRDAFCRERTERGPHGEEIHGSYWDRADELRPPDLRDSVEETFTRAAMRMQKSMERLLAKKSEPLAPVPAWWKPARCAKVLLTGAELMVEGKQMQHCVAGYAGYVKKGESVIVKLEVPERKGRGSETVWHRSTVELDRRTGQVRQHKGPQNREPHPINVKALAVLLRRWQGGR